MGRKNKKKRSFRTRVILLLISLLLIFSAVNFIFQILRKPSEVLSFLRLGKAKSLEQTWKAYKNDFNRYAIDFITPQYLAALAHVESSGNPLATPNWRVKFDTDWTKLYSPESSSVGLFQFTNSTYEQARKYCVRAGKVIRDGRWSDFNSCWFNWTYLRTSPSDSIQMAAAILYMDTLDILGSSHSKVSPKKKRELASVIHLCGKSKGAEFMRVRLEIHKLGNCGDYNPRLYTLKVEQNEKALGP